MPDLIDFETMNVDPLPGVWTPVQWDLTDAERAQEIEAQATASLLWSVDVPEAILRLLLGQAAVARAFDPPAGFDPGQQGDWNADLVTFAFKRPIRLLRAEREADGLYLEYELEGSGRWALEIEGERLLVERV